MKNDKFNERKQKPYRNREAIKAKEQSHKYITKTNRIKFLLNERSRLKRSKKNAVDTKT
jgi:hypothetical protein